MSEHCPGCSGLITETIENQHTLRMSSCPGLTCPACAEREAAKSKWGVYPCDQCAAKNEEIACLHSRIHQLESGYDTLRTVLHRKDAELARLRALVAVGREMLSASWPFELERVRAKWRSLEGK